MPSNILRLIGLAAQILKTSAKNVAIQTVKSLHD